MVDHRETEALAHELESYLRAIREGEAVLTTAGMDALIKGAGALEASIAARRANAPVVDTGLVAGELRQLAIGDRSASPASQPEAPRAANWSCVFTPSPALIARGSQRRRRPGSLARDRRNRQRGPDDHAAGRGGISVRRPRNRCRPSK